MRLPSLLLLLLLLLCRAVQVADLEASLNAVPCDGVVIATPMDLRRLLRVDKPATAVSSLEGRGWGARTHACI